MLLNTWLSAARRHFSQRSASRRIVRGAPRQSLSCESLEARTLLTALVINQDNKASFTNSVGGVVIDNAALGTFDSLVVEGFQISATSGDALSINLSGKILKSIAIESITVSQYDSYGFNIVLSNVTGLHTIAVEDVTIQGGISQRGTIGNTRGLFLNMNNTDTDALTIDDSTIPGIQIDAVNGGDIRHGLIAESTIASKTGIEGIVLNVNQGTADNFRIENNLRISSPDRDFVRVNSTSTPIDGLTIINNQVGNTTQGAGIVFRADGDTFVQPMVLSNNSTQNELLQTFVLDLTSIGLQFDVNAITGKPFTPTPASATATGFLNSVLSPDQKVLTLTFNDFQPGESLSFVIDIDLAGGIPTSVFGDDLIGADVTATLSANRIVAGQMIGDPNKLTASQFAIGPGVAGATHGINLNLTNSPTTNLTITGNTVAAAPGHGLIIDAKAFSDVTGIITNNEIVGSGRDGVRFSMVDSNFTGAVIGNNIANSGQNGVSVLPVATRSGLVERLFDTNPVTITSTNHGLQTGDLIMLQGIVNHDPTINHPANGLHTVTVIGPDRFRLNLVNGTAPGVLSEGGGAWYKPDFRSDGTIRGLVTVDMQASIPQGTVRAATNAGPIVITSPNHGLASGQRVRISNVGGNTAANGVKKITVIDADRFSLDATVGNGAYDTSTGFGTWTSNVITGASNAGPILIASPGHGLQTGEEIRVTGILGNSAANGTFKVSVVNADSFRLDGSTGNGVYGGGGNWVRLNDTTSTGDRLPQRVSGNLITGNLKTGLFVDLRTGTVFNGDIVGNTISQNLTKGIHIVSHSFGLGTDLPLDPGDPLALPGLQDISFNVNIGTSAAGDGNLLEGNTQAGIVIEALDHGTGSFEIRNNRIVSSQDDLLASTVYAGDGIVVRLTDDAIPADAISLIAKSVIDGNVIGVDNQGNEGNGLLFTMNQRTRMQDLQLTNNTFLNNGLDGFHFERSEDADLNAVVAEKNRATNNGGDGFDFFATNTTEDRLDFRVNENVISDNAYYGVRMSIVVDARVAVQFDRNQVTGNGHSTINTGFHGNDFVPGSNRAEGGVGIFAFQQADIIFSAEDSQIDGNIGDGFSVDAFNYFDTLILDATFTNTTFNNNTLTGLRNHGAAFGHIDILNSQFNQNGEDGFRSASIEDKTDVFERRVGGMNIQLTSFGSQYVENVQSGMQLGQGVSAVLGDGTISGANVFDFNGEDGLKITQSAGPYLNGQNTYSNTIQLFVPNAFQYVTRRHIAASTNYFRNNVGDGIDIGHFAQTEGGNVEHGDEVVTDVHVSISNAEIIRNGGDGIEYLADSVLRISPILGGNQDVEYAHKSSLSVVDSRVVSNKKRGIDILNRKGEDSVISIVRSDISSNGFEGIYVVNTASHVQLQNSSADPLDAYLESYGRSDDASRVYSIGTVIREIEFEVSPNIELRIQDNLIESNGSITQTSTVPINVSDNANNAVNDPDPHWTHQFRQIPGTLGGLVIRVGAVDSAGRLLGADADLELGLSGIDAEVFRNSFDGNVGADLYFDSYTSQIARRSLGNFNSGDAPPFAWVDGYRDPLSRFDLVFRENQGNSLDVINGFAYVDGSETYFKSREVRHSHAPNHAHDPLNPAGFFGHGYDRFRNQTRTTGFFNSVGDIPSSWDPGAPFPFWSFDGWGTPTWRLESDFDFNRFPTTDTTLGFSDFYDITNLGIVLAEEHYQWDTGQNVPGFTGVTPFSLARGDIFNVLPGQAPIVRDSLEWNNSFVGATSLGSISGPGFSVNSLATNNTLSIDTKGDRDYYRFTAAGTGPLALNLNATDTLGDTLYFMLYEVNPGLKSEEVPVLVNANGTAQFVVVPRGTAGVLNANVVAGREYIIEVLGNEAANVGTDANSFNYGTARTYSLSVDAPVAASPFSGGASGGGSTGGGSTGGGSTGGGSTGGGSTGGSLPGGSIPGAIPTAAFVAVAPDPRSTAVDSVTLNFSEDVTGVDITDLKLTRDGVNIPLTASMLLATPGTQAQYTINLGTLSGEAGTYKITLTAAGSGIKDTDTSLLATNATDTWIVSNSVTTNLDTPDTIVGDGVARDISGATSLRASIMESNALPGSDVIVLGSATYTLTRSGRFENASLFGDLDITGSVTIRGVSATATIINAAQLDRVFHVFAGASLTLENLTLMGGEAFDGGGIFVEPAIFDDLGVLITPGGTLILKNVNVRNNEAYNQGGGIFNAGSMTVTGSAIAQNVAGSRGGGVNNIATSSYLNTTISSNVAVSRGGGVFNETGATAGMVNVSIADNASGSRGGGLASEVSFSTRLSNSLIERNKTDAKIPVSNLSSNKDVLGVVQSLGFNSIQVLDARRTTATSAGLLVTDKFGRDATPLANLTTPLQYGVGNGVGHNALIANGLGVDTGSNALYPVNPLGQFDAVGNPRLIEGNRDGVVTIDLGAVEFLVNTPLALFVATPNPAGLNELITFNGTGSTHPNPALGFIRTWQWDFDWNPLNVPPTLALTDPAYNPFENFTQDATGVSPTHRYTNSARSSYTVRLIVTDNFGNVGFADKTVTVGIPTKPVVLRPFEFTTDQTPTISWQASPGTYRLRVDNFTTGKLDVINVGNLTANNYTPTTRLTPGRYKVTVSATNGSGTTTSDAYFFTVSQIVLGSPTGSTYDITPIFNWTNVLGTSRYDLWVTRTQPTFKGPAFRNEFISTNSYELRSSLGLGTFTWWVRAYDADGSVGDWSAPASYTVGRPTVTGPAAATLDTTPTFTWTSLGSPRYELWVNQVGGTRKIVYQTALTTNSFTPTTPLPNGLYDVWVRTIAADGEAGLWSARYRFQMDYRIGTTPLLPKGITTDTTPAFTWVAIEGAKSYNLWVDNVTTGTRQAILVNVPHVNGVANITYTHPNSLQAGDYRWWVQAVPTDGSYVAWSARTDFQVPIPSLTAPRGLVNTSTPIFRWTGVTEFVGYDLWVNNLTTGVNQVIFERNLPPIPKNFVPSLPLENGDFRAWIRGIDKDGLYSQWSAAADFTISATIGNAPRLLSPQTTIANNRPTFFWQGVANATTYEILIKDMSIAGQPTVLNVSNIAATTYTSTVTLAPGRNYRWWVRAVTTNNQPGPWSQPLDFRIVSNDSQAPADSAGPFDSTQLASIVLTAALDAMLDDDVRSITAHPAGTIVQLTPDAAASFHTESSEPVDVEIVEPVAEIDAVMEELAFDAFFMGDIDSETIVPLTPLVPAQAVINNDTASAKEEATMEAVTAGLLAAMTMSRTVSDEETKRRLQQ